MKYRPRGWVLALALTLSSAWAAPVSMPNAGFESGMDGFTTFGETVESRTGFGPYAPNEGKRMAYIRAANDDSAGFTWQSPGSIATGDTFTFAYRFVLEPGSDGSVWFELLSPSISDIFELAPTADWTTVTYTVPGRGGDPTRSSTNEPLGTFFRWTHVNLSGDSFLMVDAPRENRVSEPATLALVSMVFGLMVLSRQQQHTVSRR